MDFFTMKRKDLQRLCKKHGIRANLKNIEMAEKLSLIYKEKENENRVSRRLRNVKDKSNAEIIVLDSDSDNEVQMEAPDIVAVAEKDSNEMNNVNVEHFLDELHSSGLKDSVEETEKFLATSPLSKVKSSDLNVHRTVDSGTVGGNADVSEVKSASSQQMSRGQEESQMKLQGIAAGHVDACEVISESLQMISQGLEESPMKFTPERRDNVRPFYAEENMEMSVNVLEQFGNYMMIGENSYGTPVQFLPTSDLNIHKMVVKDTCEEGGVLKLSEETCMVADPEECIGFSPEELEESTTKGTEAKAYFDQTTHGDVMETYNRKESMVDKEHIEDNQELSPAAPTDLDDHHMVDSDTASGDEDAYKTKLNSPPKCLPIASEEKTIIFSPKLDDSSMVHKETEIEMSFPLNHERDSIHTCEEEILKTCINADPVDCIGFFDNSGVGGVGVEDENESYTASNKRKRSDVVDTNSDEEVEAGELVPTVSQPSEMMSCNFGLQQLFATDICEEEMLKLSEKEKTSMVADLEACIGSLKHLDTATTKVSEADRYFYPNILGNVVTETCRIDNGEKQNNQEDCFAAQGEVSKFFDNSDVGADELVQTAPPQPSETESCDFSLQQLFASDIASEDEDAYQKKLDSPSMATPTSSGEKNMIFTPKLDEPKMTFQCERSSDNVGSVYFEESNQMSVSKEQIEDHKELSSAPSEDNLELHHAAPREDVKVLEEFGNYMTVGEDSDGRPIQFLPTSDHNIHKMVVRDTCEEEMLELSEKTCMVADPKEDCISPLEEVSKFVENSYVYDDIGGVGAVDENQPHMTSRKRKSSDEDDNIEMSLPQKRARDNSIGTCDMKENINIDKMEEVGSIMSKTKFAKRQPLQDLQQN